MSITRGQWLTWTPRVLGILFALFVSMFALDVFSENRGVWEIAIALVMHLIPTACILIALAVAWRWEIYGGIVFLGLGVVFLLVFGMDHLFSKLMLSGPLFLIGILFLASWYSKLPGLSRA